MGTGLSTICLARNCCCIAIARYSALCCKCKLANGAAHRGEEWRQQGTKYAANRRVLEAGGRHLPQLQDSTGECLAPQTAGLVFRPAPRRALAATPRMGGYAFRHNVAHTIPLRQHQAAWHEAVCLILTYLRLTGEEFYQMAVDLRGFYLKVSLPQHV